LPYPLRDSYYSPYGPVATFLVEGVQPPAAQYIGPSDQLQLTLMAPNVGATVVLGLRLLSLKGEVQPLQYQFTTPATAGGSFVEVITPGECFLLSATIGQANVRRGQCWARLDLQRGNPTGGAAVGMVLIAGYATATDTIGYPGTPSTDSVGGNGASLVYVGPVPPVSSPATLTVPPATRWRVSVVNASQNAGGVLHSPYILSLTTAAGKVKFVDTFNLNAYDDAAANHHIAWGIGSVGGGAGGAIANAADVFSFGQAGGVDPGNQFGALSAMVEEFVEI